jgi:predicted aspartyl protease
MLLRIVLVFFVQLAAVASLWGQTTLPFDFRRGLVEVDVLIDGRIKAKLGIDTGADRLYLDDDFVKANDVEITGMSADRAIMGVGGSARGQAAELRSLAIGDQRLYNLNATVIDLAALVGSDESRVRGLDGLIGHEVLQRFYITVDYPGETITIQTTQPDFIAGGDYDEVKFSRRRHLLLVDATINGSVETPMVLDYCASHTSLDLSLAKQLGYDQPPGTVITLGSIALSDEVRADSTYAAITDLGGLKSSVRNGNFGGMLGGSFFYRYKITVDYKREKVYFHHR